MDKGKFIVQKSYIKRFSFGTDVPEGLERKMLTSKGMGSILQ